MPRPTLVRLAAFLATVVAAWGVLSLGSAESEEVPDVGAVAERTYTAQREADIVDTEATAAAQQAARGSVEDIYELSPETEDSVRGNIEAVFDDLEGSVIAAPPVVPPTTTSLPEDVVTTTPPTGGEETTLTTEPPPLAELTGIVYLDVDGDGAFNPDPEADPVDVGIEGVAVVVEVAGQAEAVTTGVDGVWVAEVVEGTAVVTVDHVDRAIPDGFIPGSESLQQELVCESGEQCTATQVGFVANLVPVEDVAATVSDAHLIPLESVLALAQTASEDVTRDALGQDRRLRQVRSASIARVNQEFGLRITNDELVETRRRLTTSPPVVFYDDLPLESDKDIVDSAAAGVVVATFIQPNYLVNETATEAERVAQADEVELVMVSYSADQVIVEQGERLTQLHIDAIDQTSSLVTGVQGQGGLLAVVAVLAALLGLYLATFRPEFWSRPRMVALLGIMLVLAAAAVRGTVIIEGVTNSWYVFPAVVFGFMTAVLFDSRIAVLMALSVGVLAAVGARDTGLAVYAVLATLAAVPFVSSVSTRGAFRNAVILSSLTAAIVAGATSWFFHSGPDDVPVEVLGFAVDIPLELIGVSMAWAFGVSVVASLAGLAALQFFESAFDITTSLSLLDLTDRNHEALQLLQEKAFGTFNHSLMVGTLAHAAARAIGGNALLARAMAYYHDLGKTENPMFFIENQFGIPNPHDLLSPKESAGIIRQHVTDGVALARKFKIPSDVAAGIVSHHGDGVMRYFYEKARDASGEDVDLDDFRHVGHKPRTTESAIVMLADSLEAACRAFFQTEEPTPDAIEKVVNRVIDEKLEDGQLQQSPVTLAELTQIRQAFLESLVGHYHQRIAYPNFPGS